MLVEVQSSFYLSISTSEYPMLERFPDTKSSWQKHVEQSSTVAKKRLFEIMVVRHFAGVYAEQNSQLVSQHCRRLKS